jgi:hypothetical protein
MPSTSLKVSPTTQATQTRSDVSVGAASSPWPMGQVRTLLQLRSEVAVGATLSYDTPDVHCVVLVQTVSEAAEQARVMYLRDENQKKIISNRPWCLPASDRHSLVARSRVTGLACLAHAAALRVERARAAVRALAIRAAGRGHRLLLPNRAHGDGIAAAAAHRVLVEAYGACGANAVRSANQSINKKKRSKFWGGVTTGRLWTPAAEGEAALT